MVLDDVITLYEHTKRNKGYSIYYDCENGSVYFSKNGEEGNTLIEDSYTLCCEIIKMYLDQPGVSCYREECQNYLKKEKNKVVSFLWFFDSVDGAYDFELYETLFIRRLLIKYCKNNGIRFADLTEYSENNHIHTFLTDERLKYSK